MRSYCLPLQLLSLVPPPKSPSCSTLQLSASHQLTISAEGTMAGPDGISPTSQEECCSAMCIVFPHTSVLTRKRKHPSTPCYLRQRAVTAEIMKSREDPSIFMLHCVFTCLDTPDSTERVFPNSSLRLYSVFFFIYPQMNS